MKQRIEYIDALRGFTMILVVFAHVQTFSFDIQPNSTLLSSLFLSFRMPLFFFISGYFAYRKENAESAIKIFFNNIVKKFRILILPTLLFGILFTQLCTNHSITEFLTHKMKLGYWFTLTLFEMFIVLHLCCMISHKQNLKGNLKPMMVLLTLFSFMMYLTLLPIWKYPEFRFWCDTTGYSLTCDYILFFILGVLAKQYSNHFNKVLSNGFVTIAMIVFISLLYIKYNHIEFQNSLLTNLYQKIEFLVLGVTGIIIVIGFFRKNEKLFYKETYLGKVLQFIGKRTLEIYLLHYFLVPQLYRLGDYLKTTSNIIIELIITIVVALMVLGCTLLLSQTIRTSRTLGKYLFNAKD